jgi:hypothetical protein
MALTHRSSRSGSGIGLGNHPAGSQLGADQGAPHNGQVAFGGFAQGNLTETPKTEGAQLRDLPEGGERPGAEFEAIHHGAEPGGVEFGDPGEITPHVVTGNRAEPPDRIGPVEQRPRHLGEFGQPRHRDHEPPQGPCVIGPAVGRIFGDRIAQAQTGRGEQPGVIDGVVQQDPDGTHRSASRTSEGARTGLNPGRAA